VLPSLHFPPSYPCVMLNVTVAQHNTNDQYQTLVDPVRHTYETSSQMSIEFEVDGPYKVCKAQCRPLVGLPVHLKLSVHLRQSIVRTWRCIFCPQTRTNKGAALKGVAFSWSLMGPIKHICVVDG